MTCDNCGAEFFPGNDELTGEPNGICFVMADDSDATFCRKCLRKLARFGKKKQNEFINSVMERKKYE